MEGSHVNRWFESPSIGIEAIRFNAVAPANHMQAETQPNAYVPGARGVVVVAGRPAAAGRVKCPSSCCVGCTTKNAWTPPAAAATSVTTSSSRGMRAATAMVCLCVCVGGGRFGQCASGVGLEASSCLWGGGRWNFNSIAGGSSATRDVCLVCFQALPATVCFQSGACDPTQLPNTYTGRSARDRTAEQHGGGGGGGGAPENLQSVQCRGEGKHSAL